MRGSTPDQPLFDNLLQLFALHRLGYIIIHPRVEGHYRSNLNTELPRDDGPVSVSFRIRIFDPGNCMVIEEKQYTANFTRWTEEVPFMEAMP